MEPSDQRPDADAQHAGENRALMRTLLWIGVAGVTAGVTYAVVRSLLAAQRPPADPTSRRIQELIDEANALLKTLDEQKHSA